MKKRLALCLALVCSLGLFSACGKEKLPQQEVAYNMTFINETGQDVSTLKIRPTEDYEWTNNLLQKDTWKTGYEVPVSLNGQVPVVEDGWQVQMTFTNGTENVWDNVTLKDADKITFTQENGNNVVSHAEALSMEDDTTEDTKTDATTEDETQQDSEKNTDDTQE